MKTEKQTTVQVDRYTRFCLTTIAVLLTLLIIGLWADGITTAGHAQAADSRSKFKDPTAAKAFKEGRWGTSSATGKMAATQQQTNAKLDELIRLLRTGDAKVQIVGETPKAGGEGNASGSQAK